MNAIPFTVVISLVFISWLLLTGMVATACRAAARGDRPGRGAADTR